MAAQSAEAAAAAATAVPIDVDLLGTPKGAQGSDISNFGDDRGNAQGSPCKRRGVGQEDAVTMTMLREILGEQTKTLLAQQREARGEIRTEIRTEIRSLEQTVKGELQTLERSCTSQFQDLQQGVQSAERGILDMESRLQALETRWSDSGTIASSGAPGKKQALVLGGWTQTRPRRTCSNSSGSLSRSSAWMLTGRRCLSGGRGGGSPSCRTDPARVMRQRRQGALAKVNYVAFGRDRPAWLVYSRSPAI